MKKFLFTTLLLTGLAALAPSAKADCQERVFVGYDRCGHPVYHYVVSRPNYYEPRPIYYYGAPVRVQSYDNRRYDYSRSQSRCNDSRPRISFSFGN